MFVNMYEFKFIQEGRGHSTPYILIWFKQMYILYINVGTYPKLKTCIPAAVSTFSEKTSQNSILSVEMTNIYFNSNAVNK